MFGRICAKFLKKTGARAAVAAGMCTGAAAYAYVAEAKQTTIDINQAIA